MSFRVIRQIPAEHCPKGSHYRLRVEIDEDWSTVVFSDEQVTSAAESAVEIEDGVAHRIELDEDQLDWAIEQLTKAREDLRTRALAPFRPETGR